MNAIETERLTKRFRPVRGLRDLPFYRWRPHVQTAVEDVSIEVGIGELFGLLGENGAGKTTLIRMLSTTLLPTSGRASVLGHDVVDDAPAVRQLIGIVSGDERSFYWRLTGRQNLEYFAALYHLPRRSIARRITELLELLDVVHHADRRFDGYSTGTKQRFAIARGMLANPRILFLDEPTRALDPIAADELRSYLANRIVGELGCTAVLATHTLAEAESICDRIAIMRAGRLVEVGTMAQLRTRMGLAPVLEVVATGCPPDLEERLCSLSSVARVSVRGDGPQLELDIGLASTLSTVTEVLRTVVESGAEVQSLVTREPNLDDVYRWAHA